MPDMKRLEKFISLLSEGRGAEGASRKAGYGSLEEAKDQIRRLLQMIENVREGEQEGIDSVVVHCDGASRGNPGPSSAGAIAFTAQGETLTSRSRKLGRATNNVAEYQAVIMGLELAGDLGAGKVILKLDSELVVKQLNGEYRIRNEKLQRLAEKARRLETGFDSCRYVHVKRAENREADRLANDALSGKER